MGILRVIRRARSVSPCLRLPAWDASRDVAVRPRCAPIRPGASQSVSQVQTGPSVSARRVHYDYPWRDRRFNPEPAPVAVLLTQTVGEVSARERDAASVTHD